MTYNEKKKQYNIEYTKKHYQRVALDVSKEKYVLIKQAAVDAGESISSYIKKAIDDRLATGK